jgi:hypothetical protein
MSKFNLIFLLIYIFYTGIPVTSHACSKCHQAAPKDYSIVTNGTNFRFISPNGKISSKDIPTSDAAISAAWRKFKRSMK